MAGSWKPRLAFRFVSVCLSVRVIVFFVPVFVGNDWQLKGEIGLQVCICVFFCVCFGVFVQFFVVPVFEGHSWQLDVECGPQVRVVCV